MQYVDDTSVHQASPSLKANVRYKEATGFISNLLIHQILDEGTSFASGTAAKRFSAGVAAFTMVMRDSNYKGTAT
jgi:Ca-activated chloride channel family protein